MEPFWDSCAVSVIRYITVGELVEIIDWCNIFVGKESCHSYGEWWLSRDHKSGTLCFYFKSEINCTAFKLKWGDFL